MEFIKTKIIPPSEPRGVVERPRLVEQLASVTNSRLTFVQAPAGYGKTTLLLQWLNALKQSGQRVGWLTFDRADSGSGALFGYLATLLSAGDPDSGQGLRDRAHSGRLVASEAVVAACCDLLLSANAPIYLFLDDVHLLGRKAAETLGRIVECAPDTTHFIMASREVLDLSLGTARARGKLFELSAEELRFTADEASAFMAEAGHQNLSSAHLDALVQRTEGWITGLKLASLAIRRGGDVGRVAESFSGRRRAVSDFFSETVFASQSPAMQEFLLETCLFARLSPALCDAITDRSNGREMLDQLEGAGLFLLPLDDEREWYRYHSLFADFLNRKLIDLDPSAARQLHLRASKWFAQQELSAEAFEHAAAAADDEWLAELLEDKCEDLTYAGKLSLVTKYAENLPERVIARHPKLTLSLAWLWTRNLRVRESRRLLDLALKRIEVLAGDNNTSVGETASLRLLYLHREMMLAAAEDKMSLVEEQCQKLIREFDNSKPYITCTLYAQLISARREQFKFDDLERLEAKAAAIPRRSGYKFADIALQSVIGPSLFAAGKAEAARNALELGLTEAVHFGGLNSGLAALPALPLSEILYETNALDRAGELLYGHLPMARQLGFVDQLISGYLIRPRLEFARGDLPAAFRALEEGMHVAFESGLERLKLNIIGERIRILLRTGQAETAAGLLKTAGIGATASELSPQSGCTTRDEVKAVAWVRVALAQSRTAEALQVAKQWRNFCQHRGAVRSQIRWNLLAVQIHALGGELQAAQRTLREAVTLAAPAALVRSFVDEGPVIEKLLLDGYGAAAGTVQEVDAFIGEVLTAFGTRSGARASAVASVTRLNGGLYGRLGARELEILNLVRAGMRNREIGDRLGLTEGTVKWYMQQIYDKTGARRRPQAVERARQFGLIA